MRALHYSLYQPISKIVAEDTGGGGGGQGKAPSQHAAAANGPSVNIPINFNTGSTDVDAQSRPNLDLLAHSLADPSLAGRKFTFVGHSDARGGDQYNVSLSLQRAQAIGQLVTSLEPSLAGRIAVEGHGAREPIDTGTGEAALRANRRLQVLVK